MVEMAKTHQRQMPVFLATLSMIMVTVAPTAAAHENTEADFVALMEGDYEPPVPLAATSSNEGQFIFEIQNLLLTGRWEGDLVGATYGCSGILNRSGDQIRDEYTAGGMDCGKEQDIGQNAPNALYFEWGLTGPLSDFDLGSDFEISQRIMNQVYLFGLVDDVPQDSASWDPHVVNCEGRHTFTEANSDGFTAGKIQLDCEIDFLDKV